MVLLNCNLDMVCYNLSVEVNTKMDKTLLTLYRTIHGTYHSYSREDWIDTRENTIKSMVKNKEVDHSKECLYFLQKIVHSRRILLRTLYKILRYGRTGRLGNISLSWDIRRYIDKKENIFNYYFEEFSNLMYDGSRFNKKLFLKNLLNTLPYDPEYLNVVIKDLEYRQYIDKKLLSCIIEARKPSSSEKNEQP